MDQHPLPRDSPDNVRVHVPCRRRLPCQQVDHRGTPEAPGLVVTILQDGHADMADTPGPDGGSITAGVVYRIKDIAAMLPELAS